MKNECFCKIGIVPELCSRHNVQNCSPCYEGFHLEAVNTSEIKTASICIADPTYTIQNGICRTEQLDTHINALPECTSSSIQTGIDTISDKDSFHSYVGPYVSVGQFDVIKWQSHVIHITSHVM